MATIPTAASTIDSAEMGRTLAHEHVFVLGTEYQQNYQDWDEETRVAEAVTALAELKSLGIDSILDPTVLGLGRYVPRVRRIAEQVDLNIVVATGLYTYSDLPFQFHYNGPGLLFDMPEPLTELFVKDLTEGIGDTGVRAAFLKCAIETPGLTPGVERVLRAVGQAHVRTGAPVMVHTNPHTQSGLVAQRVLAEEGVDLSKVVLAHCGDSTDVDHLTELADAGSLLGMDRFGLDELLPFEQRVDTIVRLVERGY
ncbi:phosphotriesterase-related protein, partial [Thermocatellispora tengchongensis]